jgi:hypothetical protein
VKAIGYVEFGGPEVLHLAVHGFEVVEGRVCSVQKARACRG